MSWTDIVILIVVILILGVIIYFSFIRPKMQGRSIACANCASASKVKRIKKKIKKELEKDKKNNQ